MEGVGAGVRTRHTHMRAHTRTFLHIHVCFHTQTRTHTTHTHTHTCTHTHTHTPPSVKKMDMLARAKVVRLAGALSYRASVTACMHTHTHKTYTHAHAHAHTHTHRHTHTRTQTHAHPHTAFRDEHVASPVRPQTYHRVARERHHVITTAYDLQTQHATHLQRRQGGERLLEAQLVRHAAHAHTHTHTHMAARFLLQVGHL